MPFSALPKASRRHCQTLCCFRFNCGTSDPTTFPLPDRVIQLARRPCLASVGQFQNGTLTRIEDRSGASVDALTFHALGYAIIREVEGGAPALAAQASDDAQFRILLRDILFNDIVTSLALRALLLKWFSAFYWPYKSEWDFKTKDEYFQYVEAHELRTFQGELVKSFEEWEIANWLYLNGIAYDYEPDYEHNLPENTRTAYTPDFKLTESGVYIEHFGVRKSRTRDGSTVFTTAPYVDRTEYLEGMEWKRKVHEDHETTLVLAPDIVRDALDGSQPLGLTSTDWHDIRVARPPFLPADLAGAARDVSRTLIGQD